MKKKTTIIIVVSVIGFMLLSAAGFTGAYYLTSFIIKESPEIFGQSNQAPASYSVLTKELLTSLKDDELEQAIADHIWTYKVKEDYDKDYEITKTLPDAMKYLYATWTLELEVDDGGFSQFFENYGTDFTKEAIDGYRFFGANEQADVVAEAVGAYYKKGERQFDDLDDKFYSNESKATDLKIKYIREHIDQFTTK